EGTQILRFIFKPIFVFGESDLAVGIEAFADHRFPIDFHTVAAAEILDKPVTVLDSQTAVLSRDVRKLQRNIAAVAAANQQTVLQQRNGISSTRGNEHA